MKIDNVGVASAGASLEIGAEIDGATEGSVLFAGAGGLLSQDNTNFFYNDTDNRLLLANLRATGLQIRDTSADHLYTIGVSELAADRTITLPLLTADDTFAVLGLAQIFTAAQVVNSNAAAAFSVGPNGDTNPVLRVVCNVASAATGISITGRAAGGGIDLTALSSGSNESIIVTPKGTGALRLSSGMIQFQGATSSFPAIGRYQSTINLVALLADDSNVAPFGASLINLISYLRMGNNGAIIWTDANTFPLISGTADTAIVRAAARVIRLANASAGLPSTGSGSLIIGSSSAAVGTNGIGVLVIENQTAPASSPANLVQIYAADDTGSSEAHVRDEAGNVTVFSPHSFRMVEPEAADLLPWTFYSRNHYIGLECGVNMYKLARLVEQLTGQTLIEIDELPPGEIQVWEENQEAIRLERERERAEWRDRRRLHDERRREDDTLGEFEEPEPEEYIVKPCPQWIVDRLPATRAKEEPGVIRRTAQAITRLFKGE